MLQESFQDTKAKLDYFDTVDIILACIETYEITKNQFSHKQVILVENVNNLEYEIFKTYGVLPSTIGIISYNLVRKIIFDHAFLSLLQKLCIRLVIYKNCYVCDSSLLRKKLHETGFYEIVVISSPNQENLYDYSSVGIFSDGRHDIYSCYPGLPMIDNNIYVASKLSITHSHTSKLNWCTIMGSLNYDFDGNVCTANEEFALATYNSFNMRNVENKVSIHAKARWLKYGIGHVSLIGNYIGPGDSNMYAALLQLVNDNTINVSLWKNDGEWLLVKNINKVIESKVDNVYELMFSLSISKTLIDIKIEDQIVIEANNTMNNDGSFGIRLHSDILKLSDITIVHEDHPHES